MLFGLAETAVSIKVTGKGQYIYALVNPITDKVFYIGRSRNPGRRYIEHINESTGTVKDRYIQSMKNILHIPYMIVLEQCSNEDVKSREKFWIDRFGGVNRLTNMKRG